MKHCLIIDDDQDDQEIFILCIAKLSADIVCKTANDGVEALDLLTNSGYVPDLIFLDVNMPKMNGIDCLKRIRAIDSMAGTYICMYSTTSEVKVVNEAMAIGADRFVVKPARVSELTGVLAGIFNIANN